MTSLPRGRPPRTDAQRAEQRTRLLEAAMAAIRLNGPDVSLMDMARAAGVSKPVLYSEFGDKQGVADAIAVTLAQRVERDIVANVVGDLDLEGALTTGAVDARAAVTEMTRVLIDLVDSEPDVYKFLVRSLRANDRGFLDNALVRVIHERSMFFLRFFSAEVDAGDVQVVVDAAFGMILGAVESWQSDQTVPKERLIELLSGAIYAGLNSVIPLPQTKERKRSRVR
jgi:AcrR family transcriptional regulator